MNAKPKEAIERMREWKLLHWNDVDDILAYIDSIPDNAVCVVWPAELTRERLIGLAEETDLERWLARSSALRVLAAIAPVRKKLVVNLWRNSGGHLHEMPLEWDPSQVQHQPNGWRKVNIGGPVELSE